MATCMIFILLSKTSPIIELNYRCTTRWFRRSVIFKQATTLKFRLRFGTAQTPEYLFKKVLSPYYECGECGDINNTFFGCTLNSASVGLLLRDIYTQVTSYGPIYTSYFICALQKIAEALFCPWAARQVN